MEFIVVYIVVAVLLSMLTGSLLFIVAAILSIIMFFVAATELYFFYMIILLLFSKPCKGEFVRVEQVTNTGGIFKNVQYMTAVYNIDGTEYRSVFPAEGLFGHYFYRKGVCRLFLNKKKQRVFDKYNTISCIVWPIFCTALLAGAVYMIISMAQGYTI